MSLVCSASVPAAQEFLDDGQGNVKGIKMVNVRWEKIDGQMRGLAEVKEVMFVVGQMMSRKFLRPTEG